HAPPPRAGTAPLASQNAAAPPPMVPTSHPASTRRVVADGQTCNSTAHHAASASDAAEVPPTLRAIERTPRAPKRRRAMITRNPRFAYAPPDDARATPPW